MMFENKIYNPAGQSKEWLIEHFVVRTKVFEKIFKDIKKGKMKYPEQHYLIQGQRGMGKTTLLLRLKYEVENDVELNSWLVPVFFNEESYDLTSLSNLWEKLLKYLDSLWQTNELYYKKTDEFIGSDDYEKKCFDLLIAILNEKKKKLVIFFDNFGQLFLDNLKEKEQHRLREILMNCSDIRIIGASAVVMEDLYDYSKPFFEFFKIINLEGLTKEETLELIIKIQEKSDTKIDIEKNKAKIETLAILTGGVIRTIMLIYEAILADEDGTALRDLEAILDKITPLYKHRIEDLPVQQRKIVDVIAKKWDAISTKEISQNIRENGQTMDTKLISAQLQQLEKNNIIEKKQTNTKNHLYQVKERFFNIWYLMRNGDRYDKCRVIWLTKFLELFYEEGFDGFLKNHIKHLRSGNYHSGAALMISEALANSDKLDVMSKDQLLRETSNILSDETRKLLPDITVQKLKTCSILASQYKWQEAITIINSIENKKNSINIFLAMLYLGAGDAMKSQEIMANIVVEDAVDKLGMAMLYLQMKEHAKAIKLLESYEGPEKGMASHYIGLNLLKIDNEEGLEFLKKAVNLGFLPTYEFLIKELIRIKKIDEALAFSLEAVSKDVANIKSLLIEIYMLYKKDFQKGFEVVKDELKINPKNPTFNFFLGVYLYTESKFDEAKDALLLAHEYSKTNKNDYAYYYTNLVLLFDILIEIYPDKPLALQIVQNLPQERKPLPILFYVAFIKIWNNKFEEVIDELLICLDVEEPEKYGVKANVLQDILLLLIAKKQYYTLLKIFDIEKYKLKDKYKPIYYTLMQYMKDEFPNEHLRMGEELKQPVADLMKRVEEMAIEYA
jgi:hypothetical protein